MAAKKTDEQAAPQYLALCGGYGLTEDGWVLLAEAPQD